MREWINIMESKNTIDTSVKAQELRNAAMKLVADFTRFYSFGQQLKWDQSYVTILNDLLKIEKQNHIKNEQEEVEYQSENGKTYTPSPFSLKDCITDVTSKWWDSHIIKDDLFTIETDTKFEYERYQDEHPTTEQSDEMSGLYNQVEMTKKIHYKGSDTLEGLREIISALDNYNNQLNYYSDVTDITTHSVIDFIQKIIPAILYISKAYGAKKS